MPQPTKVQSETPPRARARGNSLESIELKHFLSRPVFVVTFVKHIVSALYYVIVCYLNATTNHKNLQIVQAYAPNAMSIIMAGFALLHLHGLVWVSSPRHCFSSFSFVHVDHYFSAATQLTLFHLVDVFCQTYQAARASQFLLDRPRAFGFLVVVALNCLVTPWFLLSKHKVVCTTVARRPSLHSSKASLAFFSPSSFQTYVCLVPALQLTLYPHGYQFDLQFTIQLVRAGRYLLVSSPLDLVTKFVIQYSSYAAQRKLVSSMMCVVTTQVVKAGETTTAAHVSQHLFQLEVHRHRGRLLYAMASSVWGVTIAILSIVANWGREPCPSTCILQVAPWRTLTCQCAHVQINCVTQAIVPSDSIDAYLGPDPLGTSLHCIDVRRCALVQHRTGVCRLDVISCGELLCLWNMNIFICVSVTSDKIIVRDTPEYTPSIDLVGTNTCMVKLTNMTAKEQHGMGFHPRRPSKSIFQTMANKAPDAAPWYQDESDVVQAIARAVDGYKGQVAERCHVIPRGMVVYSVDYDNTFRTESSCGTCTRLSNKTVKGRLRDLCQVMDEEDDHGIDRLMVAGVHHIELALEDGAGVQYELDVLVVVESIDVKLASSACVWDHDSGHLVGNWVGNDESLYVTWEDKKMAARFVPHPANVIPTTVNNEYLTKNVDGTPFARMCPSSPITCSLGDGKNQLELMVLVAAHLAQDETYFPRVVPEALLQQAKASYFMSLFGDEDLAVRHASDLVDLVLYVDNKAEY
ncbi:Aste57867_8478 [Aphanomyces stellatus]|uniref:Aste57867_8478 protein n=1 Tax=Aphanomyces stellatus TaxID=120398 RepID=A0A485KKD9_9STRA|nr:hypothetical protein As57867_008446 [Aphanomyces stellatus]VFT85364.1 Aste57867_8478 [Aphanomyces stellatus]